jgi:hypothetical protein
MEKIDIDKLFYDLFTAIFSSSPIRRLIVRKDKQSQMEKFTRLTAKFKSWYENTNSGNGIRCKDDLKIIFRQIKDFLRGILKPKNESALFKLMELYELYNNLDDENLEILKGGQSGEYLKEAFDWIANLLNAYYIIPPRPRVSEKLDTIFERMLQLAEDVIRNKSVDVFPRDEKSLFNVEVKDQKLRLSNGSLKYMCDVIAMLDKKTINNFVFSQSSDDDLNAYYRNLENELSQKNENSRTSNEKEFLAVADEYFSRNFAAAMWKTYTEYTYLFRNWSDREKKELSKTFRNNFIVSGEDISKKDNFDYFILPKKAMRLDDTQNEIYELLKKYGITRFVFVRQNVKAKMLDPYTTFFAFKDNVLRFRDIELFNKQKIDQPFFYFYYIKDDKSLLETNEVTELLENLHDMMKKKANERLKATGSGFGSNE